MKKTFLTLLILTGLISCKQTNETAKLSVAHTKKSQKLDSLYNEMLKYGEFNGNVLIAENDTIILQKSYGVADRENNELLIENSIFNHCCPVKIKNRELSFLRPSFYWIWM